MPTGEYSMNTNYDVSVVIINYNSKKYIDNLFESLIKLKHSDFTFQIVVVDNASTDDSIEYLVPLPPAKIIPFICSSFQTLYA